MTMPPIQSTTRPADSSRQFADLFADVAHKLQSGESVDIDAYIDAYP